MTKPKTEKSKKPVERASSPDQPKPMLPQGWVETTIGDICDLNPRFTADDLPSDDIDVSFVPMAAVEEESGRLDASETRPAHTLRKGYTPFKENDILFAKITPCMENGKIAVATGLKNGLGYGSTEFFVLRPFPGINPRYILHFLLQQSFRDNAQRQMTGAVGQKRVPKNYLLVHKIPLPPSAEQERIVAKLDAMLSRIAAGESAARRALERLDCYRAAVLHAAVTGELTREWRKTHKPEETGEQLLKRLLIDRHNNWKKDSNLDSSKQSARNYREPNPPQLESTEDIPHGWTWATLEQLTSQVATGATPLRSNSDYWNNGTISWVTSGATNADLIQSASAYITDLAITETNAKLFPKGTLLLAMYGEGKTRGMVSELDIDAATNQACAALLFQGDNRVIQPYVKLFLKKNYEDIRRMASGGVQPNLSLDIVKRMCVPLPPLKEQIEIMREVDLRFSAAEKVTITLKNQLDNVHTTRQSTLCEAFTGQLVSQDPNDEAISAILGRIHLAQETETKQPKAKRMSKTKPTFTTSNLFDLIKTTFGDKSFTFAALRKEVHPTEYDNLRNELYALLRPVVAGATPVLKMTFDAKKETMEFKLTQP